MFVCIVLCVSVKGIWKEKNRFEAIREGDIFERMRPVQRKPSAHISLRMYFLNRAAITHIFEQRTTLRQSKPTLGSCA